MLIIALQGSAGSIRDTITTQFTKLPKQRVVTIDVSYLPATEQRVATLRRILHHQKDVLNVVIGTETGPEIAFLRQHHAMFCHVRGPYPSRLRDLPNNMLPGDVAIVPEGENAPEWYLTPEEAFSEYLTRRRRRWAA